MAVGVRKENVRGAKPACHKASNSAWREAGSCKKTALFEHAVVLCTAIAPVTESTAVSGDAPRITKEEAKVLLGAQKVVFVDARTDSNWSRSDKKIKGAVRPDKWDLESWAGDYTRETKFIVY